MFYSEIIQNENSLICVEDALEKESLFLVKDFINGHVKEAGDVHIHCYDRSVKQVKLLYGSSSKHHYHSYITEGSFQSGVDWDSMVKHYSFLGSLKPNLSDRCYTVVIDSLSCLLIHQNFRDVYRELRRLIKQRIFKSVFNIQIVAIVHKDALENSELVIPHLKRLAKVWIDIQPDRVVQISVKGKNGRSDVKEYSYNIDVDGNITSKTELTKNFINIQKESPTVEPISTFNLKLTDEEKLARSNITLPYTRREDNIAATGQDDIDDRNFSDDDEVDYCWNSSDEEEDY